MTPSGSPLTTRTIPWTQIVQSGAIALLSLVFWACLREQSAVLNADRALFRETVEHLRDDNEKQWKAAREDTLRHWEAGRELAVAAARARGGEGGGGGSGGTTGGAAGGTSGSERSDFGASDFAPKKAKPPSP